MEAKCDVDVQRESEAASFHRQEISILRVEINGLRQSEIMATEDAGSLKERHAHELRQSEAMAAEAARNLKAMHARSHELEVQLGGEEMEISRVQAALSSAQRQSTHDDMKLHMCRSELTGQEAAAKQRESELAHHSRSTIDLLRSEFQAREASLRREESELMEHSAREWGEQREQLRNTQSQEINEMDREYDSVKKAYHSAKAELQECEMEKRALVEMVERHREDTARLTESLKLEQQRVVDIERATRTHLDLIDREVVELHKSKQALDATSHADYMGHDPLDPLWFPTPARGRHRQLSESQLATKPWKP